MPAITHEHVKRRLQGVAPYIEADGIPTELYDEVIAAAHQRFERELQIFIDPQVIKCRPDDSMVAGEDYDREEAGLPYTTGSIDRHTLPHWHTRRRPVISVEDVRLTFGENFQVLNIPDEWIEVNKHIGRIDILPKQVGAIASSMGAWYAPLLDRAWKWKVIPQFVRIDYTAGYENPETNQRMAEMRMELARMAAVVTMRDHRRAIPTSESLEGFSQQFSSMEQIISEETELVEKFLRDWQKQNRPARMVVL